MKKYHRKIKRNTNQPQFIIDLRKLRIINKKNTILFKKGCRDNKSINVLKDKKYGTLFLDKLGVSDNYYKRKKTYFDKQVIKIGNSKKILPKLENTVIHVDIVKKLIKNKVVCDFGSGYGANFSFLQKNVKECYGVEISDTGILISKKKFPQIEIKKNISDFTKKFDVILLFDVFAHLINPIKKLDEIRSMLKKNGKIIITSLHANDFISTQLNHVDYNNFRFTQESLILHSEYSITKFLKNANFKNIVVKYGQRYGLSNLFGWLFDKKPGGHLRYNHYINEQTDSIYKKTLEDKKLTDTILVIGTKK